jgi:hypothetical protein
LNERARKKLKMLPWKATRERRWCNLIKCNLIKEVAAATLNHHHNYRLSFFECNDKKLLISMAEELSLEFKLKICSSTN